MPLINADLFDEVFRHFRVENDGIDWKQVYLVSQNNTDSINHSNYENERIPFAVIHDQDVHDHYTQF